MNKSIKYLIEYKNKLNENTFKFNPIDYENDDNDIISSNNISSMLFKYRPQTKEELQKAIEEIAETTTSRVLDLSQIDTSLITDMSLLFKLLNINYNQFIYEIIFDRWDTSNVTDMSQMFYGCEQLRDLNLSQFDTSKVKKMSSMFNGCTALTRINLSSFDTSNVENMACMFNLCESLVRLDLTNFDTSNVEDMSNMFGGCKWLKTIDMSDKWKVNKKTATYWMFYDCNSLVNINFSTFTKRLNPELEYMFHQCPADIKYKYLKETDMLREGIVNFNPVDYSNDDLDIIDSETIHNMILVKPKTKDELKSLIQKRINVSTGILDLSDIDTSLITDMMFLFKVENKQYIKKIIFGKNWNTSNVISFQEMFYGLEKLTELDLSYFDTSKVIDMSVMFCDCKSLQHINLTSFDTSNVMYMYNMFDNCQSLKELDLTSFDTSSIEDMECMFRGCKQLKTIKLSNSWTINEDVITDQMFYECELLTNVNFFAFPKNLYTMFDTDSSNLINKYEKECMD